MGTQTRQVTTAALADGDILPLERAVIGGVLLEQAAKIPPLASDEFFSGAHQAIWRAILRVAETNHPDLVTVHYDLDRSGELTMAGGPAHLALCVEEASIASHLMRYAELVRAAARERRLRALGIELAQQGLTEAEIHVRLAELPGPLTGPLFDPAENWRRIVASWEHGRYKTGYAKLDDMNGGFGGGELVAIGAPRSYGKTSWCVNLAMRFAEAGIDTEYVTLEESPDAIVRRMVAGRSGVSTRKLKDGTVSEEEFRECERAVQYVQGLPVTVTGMGHLRSLEEETIVGAVSVSRAKILFVDHVQQITTRDPSRTYGLERVVKRLQGIGLRDEKVIFLAAQLNREMDARQGPPRLSDFRDTASLEYAPRQILLLYWPIKHDDTRMPHEYEVYLAKQSDGGTGMVRFRFEAWCGRFDECVDSGG